MIFANIRFRLLAIAASICITRVALAGPVPSPQPAERYSALWQKSPFTIASVEEAPKANFAQNLAVVAIARIGNDDTITLLNKQSQQRFQVGIKQDSDGYKVLSVTMDSDPLKVVVKLQKGNETATVGFDKALLAANTSPPPPPGQPQNTQSQPPPAASTETNGQPLAARKVRRVPVVPAPTQPPPVTPTSSAPNPSTL